MLPPAVAAPTANSSVTIAGVNASAVTRFRMARAASGAARRMPAINSLPFAGARPVGGSVNLAALQEGHRISLLNSRLLELW